MRRKIYEWIKRYAPAEIFATLGAVIGASAVFLLTQNRIASAYAGAIGETICFYLVMLTRDIIAGIVQHKSNNKEYRASSLAKDTRNILIEFGPAEMFDSLVIRPFLMYFFSLYAGNFAVGILLGKISADVVFYFPVVISYELRKKYVK